MNDKITFSFAGSSVFLLSRSFPGFQCLASTFSGLGFSRTSSRSAFISFLSS